MAIEATAIVLELTVIAHPCVALFTLIKPVFDCVESESVGMIDFAVVAYPEVALAAVTLEDIFKLYTV